MIADFEVEEAVIHFFTIHGTSTDEQWWTVYPERVTVSAELQKFFGRNGTFWKLLLGAFSYNSISPH